MRTGPLLRAKSEVEALLGDIDRFSPDQRGQINWLAVDSRNTKGGGTTRRLIWSAHKKTPPEDASKAARLTRRAEDMVEAAESREVKRAAIRVKKCDRCSFHIGRFISTTQGDHPRGRAGRVA